MPMNPPPPNVLRPKAPPPPPPPMRNPNIPDVPRPPRRPPVLVVKDQPFIGKAVGWLLLAMGVVIFALGYAKVMGDLDRWAEDYTLRHCSGKFDTPECRADQAKERAKAYSEYKERQ